MTADTTQGERLRRARERAGYASAADAARAIGVADVTYRAHENQTNGLSRSGQRYARFFHVRYEWLMTGHGEMLDDSHVPISGLVGAGARIQWTESAALDRTDVVTLPTGEEALAFLVRGDSQWPRYLDGEIVLAERAARTPRELIDQYAVVQTDDGRTLVKLVRALGPDSYGLESHNAPPERPVKLMLGHRCLGSLTRKLGEQVAPPPAFSAHTRAERTSIKHNK